MPKKGKNTDSLLVGDGDGEASGSTSNFTSESVLMIIDKITTNFTVSFNSCVDRIVDAVEKKLGQRIDSQAADIFDLHKKMETLERNNKQLETLNSQLSDKCNQLGSKIEGLSTALDDLEQHSRNSNLLIHGVSTTSAPGTSETNLIHHVTDLLNNLMQINIQEADIGIAHRVGRPPSSSGSGTTTAQRPQPIVVQFLNKAVRNSTLARRRLLKGKGVSITEQLTVRRSNLLKKSSDLVSAKKLESAWSHDGKVIIKTLNHRTVVINNDHDLIGY